MWPFQTKAEPVEIKSDPPTELTDPTSESWEALTSGFLPSASGVAANAFNAMRVPAVSCAVRTIAETVATLPAKVFRIAPDGKTEDPSHNAWPLVFSDANEWMSAGKVRENVTIDALLYGDGFAWVNKVDGKPVEIIHLLRGQVAVDFADNGEPTYRIGTQEYPPDQIIHVQSPSITGKRGLGLLNAGADTIGLAILLERTASNLQKNNARPGGVLSFKGSLKADALKRIGDAWRKAHGGENAGGIAPLDNEGKYTPIAFTSVESQHVEQMVFSIGQISRLTRVPVTMLQDLSAGTVSNTEQQNLQFLQLCLLPWLRAWTDAYRRCLLTKEERSTVSISFDVDDLLRGDSAARADAAAKYRAAGVLTANDVRRTENLPALPDGNTLSSPFTTPGAPAASNDNKPKPTEAAA